MMRLYAGVASDRGLVRSANEDSFLLRRGLYAVCDGMGGARGGEVASQMACLSLLALNPASAGQQELRAAISGANQSISHRGSDDAHLLGMGTTITVVLVREGHLTLAHVGDSRAYILHSGELTQLTEDHSWVAEMVRRGELTPAQAAVHPHRSVITRALGTEGDVDPDLLEIPLVPGDRIMLCSDGLSGMVTDFQIEELLGREEGPQQVAEALVKAALVGGGEDNVTVIVVDVLPDGEHGEKPEAVQETASLGADQILFGPSDRGGAVAASSHRGRRGSPVRGRLGFNLPSIRPAVSRSGGEGGVGPAAPAEGEETSEGPAAAEKAPAEPAPTVDAQPLPEPGSEREPAAVDAPALGGAPRKKRRRFRLFLALAVVLVVVAAIAGFAVYNANVYYLGIYKDGTVALYQGLPDRVLGIELSQAVEWSGVSYDALAPYLQERVENRERVSEEDGQLFLRGLAQQQ